MNARVQEVLAHVGANVRRFRMKRDLTQGQLADAAGLDRQTIRDLEVGKANPSTGNLVLIADALGVRPGLLFRPRELPEIRRGRPPKKPAE